MAQAVGEAPASAEADTVESFDAVSYWEDATVFDWDPYGEGDEE